MKTPLRTVLCGVIVCRRRRRRGRGRVPRSPSGNASDLQVGDCFEVPDGDSIGDVQHQPCNESHDGEVFLVGNYTGDGDTYPTSVQFDTWVGTECVDKAFPTYTGTAALDREDLDIGYFYPLEENWGKGDRQMICYLSPSASPASRRRPGRARRAPRRARSAAALQRPEPERPRRRSRRGSRPASAAPGGGGRSARHAGPPARRRATATAAPRPRCRRSRRGATVGATRTHPLRRGVRVRPPDLDRYAIASSGVRRRHGASAPR